MTKHSLVERQRILDEGQRILSEGHRILEKPTTNSSQQNREYRQQYNTSQTLSALTSQNQQTAHRYDQCVFDSDIDKPCKVGARSFETNVKHRRPVGQINSQKQFVQSYDSDIDDRLQAGQSNTHVQNLPDMNHINHQVRSLPKSNTHCDDDEVYNRTFISDKMPIGLLSPYLKKESERDIVLENHSRLRILKKSSFLPRQSIKEA